MQTTRCDNPDLETTSLSAFASYDYAITHVFFPVELPHDNDYTLQKDLSLVHAVCAAANAYGAHVKGAHQWHRIIKMLDNLQASTASEHLDSDQVTSQLSGMQAGDILAFSIRPQNGALILTRRENCVLFESFEVSSNSDAVEKTEGSLTCSYPSSAIEVDIGHFRSELINFFSHPNAVDPDLPSLLVSPQHFTALLTSTLPKVGCTVDVPRVTKRIRDDARRRGSGSSEVVWRRSSLWLLIRVSIQMAVDRPRFGCASYKRFMLFFICTLARDLNNRNLSSDLLHLMSSKIFRRLSKLGLSASDWLSELALDTCTCLREILDARWKPLSVRSSLFRNPSQDELRRDTQLSLLDSREYIRHTLANHGHEPFHAPFHPSHRPRGTIEDFLSSNGSFYGEAYDADPEVILYDVEQSVEQGIDDWIASVTNVEEACVQLEILMDRYMINARNRYNIWNDGNPEDYSIMLLTGIELFVALDKLALKEHPMLADYFPDLPIVFLERLLLRKTTSLHRLARAYQYILARQSQSCLGLSILSNEFTEDSFAVRYYDESPHLQQLQARIEEDAMVAGHNGAQLPHAVAHPYDSHQEYHQHSPGQSPLPALPLHAKVVVFELHCPACIRIWRSAAPRILYYFNELFLRNAGKESKANLLACVPALGRYFVHWEEPSLRVQIHFAYFYSGESQSQNRATVRYVLYHPDPPDKKHSTLSIWQSRDYEDWEPSFNLTYGYESTSLWDYVNYTSHTSNDVLATQAHCPVDFSLDEFIAFGHLRSGGLFQWLNILRGLRSRSLNLHRHHVHFLLACAASEVGPLDSNTGMWLWHKELQDSSFCDPLLDELDSLFWKVGAGSIDGVMMSTISLILTRVLASSPSKRVSERAIALLRSVRRKTFNWVQELLYNLIMAPMNEERSNLLQDMAAICRSTFDIDPAILRNVLHSVEDVDALVSCSLLIYALHPEFTDDIYARVLLKRDRSLSLAVEGNLRDIILADASDYGVDLAVGKIFARHKPSASRWEQSQGPSARWLTCKTEATRDQPSQTVHVNLLDGELRVDGQPLGGLLRAIRTTPECQQIFRDGFFLIPSNLPGMDFTTLTTRSEHKVHFSLRDHNLVVRAHCDQTNEILELIPSSIMRGDLPPVLVDGHVHWLNLSTKLIEIRPFERLWEQSTGNWRIDCASEQFHMYKGCEALVDIRSPTWAMVSKCFECLNSLAYDNVGDWFGNKDSESLSKNLLITMSPISLQFVRMSVTLPSYGLSFFVNERRELESRDFKDMVYDENQCVGALFGLENLLVLRQKTHLPEELIPRCVLIPSGFPKKHGDHQVRVHTKRNPFSLPDDLLHHYTYVVDTELGCFTGNGSLASMRYLAYLHAATSCHRPDPLTGKTGAQAALSLLQSAGCRSIMKLKSFDGDHSWTSTQYPQINIAYKEIRQGCYWNRYSGLDHAKISCRDKCSARRAAYLFPWHAAGSVPPKDCNEPWQITLDQLLPIRPAPELPARSTLPRRSQKTAPDDIPGLNPLLSLLMKRSDPSCQREYITQLNASVQRVRRESRTTRGVAEGNRIEALGRYYVRCRDSYLDALDTLRKSLGPTTDPREQTLDRFSQWPPNTADVLLRCLSSTSPIDLPPRWKKCLVSFALLLLDLQRSRRLLRFALDGLEEEFSKELDNEGCEGWKPEEYPDWLLIQVQGNFLIRRTQAETAMEMMSPKSGGNIVMQVSMGEGKSSVIIPIAAAALADGKQLVRVIAPKPLTVQMFELLVSRLGGLANRPIYHLPFSRNPEHDEDGRVISLRIDDLHRLMSQCMAERGLLLVQPEHVVSLKLMGVEEQVRKGQLVANPFPKSQQSIYNHIMITPSLKCLRKPSFVANIFQSLSRLHNYSGKTSAVRASHHGGLGGDSHGASDSTSKWVNLQTWMHSHVRDILDESDEILHTRFQLIYTIGLQQHMDGYPDRWTITQQVLQLVKSHVYSLSMYAPDFVEYERCPPGSFPHVHFVRSPGVRQRLILSIVEDVMAGQLTDFNFQYISPALHRAIRSFISDEDILPDTAKRVEEYAKSSQQSHLWNGLLLLRGLLTSNVLLFALTEWRWRVDYGLLPQQRLNEYSDSSPIPTMLAVPYRAKDMPAPNTQFSHPDVTIILTCLSYYYAGLSKEQLKSSFEILLDQDDPSTEYALWVKEYDCESLPDSLQVLGEINLKTSEQWDKDVFPLFARNKAVIDFYLSRVVFSKEAKEFPWKISGSSWDLAETRENVTTGFSGTNDGHWLLPMSIAQHNLDHQQGANARVLACLLRPENDTYMVTHESGGRQTTLEFLLMATMQQPEIRVLLDVGAQILDFSNHAVAKAWLHITPEAAGAIYFDENDELMVLTKSGFVQSMISSPLSQQLDRCIVYLDHAHTRGTDITLPIGSRAAVTLGPKVTKDSLVQGCMRMRKLGRGHSVMFFAPLQVDRSIRGVVGKQDPNTRITIVDILCWTIYETWADIQQRTPYWAQQGMSHKLRSDAWSSFCNNKLGLDQLSVAWLQPELKSLADLYAPCETKKASLSDLDPEIRQRCKDLGVLSLSNAQMEEEHEREVDREREREREVELPPTAKAAEHFLHHDVVAFVNTGIIPPLHPGGAFHPVFTTLEKSSAATREADVWSPFILATADFCKTVDPDSTGGTADPYLRPVQWVLSCKKDHEQVLVLLSPFEAHHLMPYIMASKYVHFHVYAPRMSQRMKPSDDLKLYSIPPLPSGWIPPWDLIDQLNVFAGQLYLRNYQSYVRLCRFLDVPTNASSNGLAPRRNLFNIPGSFEEDEIGFSGSPLPSVMALLSIRSRGRPFAQTHMGKILQGQLLTEKDFSRPTSVVSGQSPNIYDWRTQHNTTPENIVPSLFAVECNGQDSLGSSRSLRSCKRGPETAETSDTDNLKPPQKRLRSG